MTSTGACSRSPSKPTSASKRAVAAKPVERSCWGRAAVERSPMNARPAAGAHFQGARHAAMAPGATLPP
eukprot:3432352-Pyramimonas_sp.AAC.1